jgi:hypothetical protein
MKGSDTVRLKRMFEMKGKIASLYDNVGGLHEIRIYKL